MARRDPEAVAARNRRRFARRQWRRRWLTWKWVLAIVLLAGATATGVWLVFFSTHLAVSDVRITGTGLLTAGDVRKAAQVPDGKPLALVDVDAIEHRVEGLAPVKDATVTRSWPHTIAIEIEERTAVAVVDLGGGDFRGMDEDGVIFRRYPRAPQGLPKVQTEGNPTADALAEAAAIVSALPRALASRVDHISVETVDQISLVLRGGRTIVWGSAEDSETKAEVAVALLGKVQAQVYDVSVPGQPTTRSTP